MESIVLGVVYTFAPEVEEVAVGLSGAAQRLGKARYELDAKFARPHCTIYQTRFPEVAMPEIRSRFAAFEPPREPFTFDQLAVMDPGFVFWDASAGDRDRLRPYQEAVISSLSPLRTAVGSIAAEQNLNLPVAMREAEARTGYVLAEGAFRPHITITRYESNADAERFIAFVSSVRCVARPAELALVRCGRDGQMAGIVELKRFVP